SWSPPPEAPSEEPSPSPSLPQAVNASRPAAATATAPSRRALPVLMVVPPQHPRGDSCRCRTDDRTDARIHGVGPGIVTASGHPIVGFAGAAGSASPAVGKRVGTTPSTET